jgi:hypothetical protein
MSKYIIYRDKTHEPFKHQILNQTNQETNGTTQPLYEECTKGDVSKLCEHTRELTYELNAAGETTNDLLENLIEALKEAPDTNFPRWVGKSGGPMVNEKDQLERQW